MEVGYSYFDYMWRSTVGVSHNADNLDVSIDMPYLNYTGSEPFPFFECLGDYWVCANAVEYNMYFAKKAIDEDGTITYPCIVREISQNSVFRPGMISKLDDNYILIADKVYSLRLISVKQCIENEKVDFNVIKPDFKPDIIKCSNDGKRLYFADGLKIGYRTCTRLSLGNIVKINDLGQYRDKLLSSDGLFLRKVMSPVVE